LRPKGAVPLTPRQIRTPPTYGKARTRDEGSRHWCDRKRRHQHCPSFERKPGGKEDPLGVDDLATHQLSLAEAPSAYEMFQKKEDGAIKVVLKP
jgi:hypothetical protein